MENRRGSYALLFYCPREVNVTAGKQGELALQQGYYLYCGSAFGPGGVKARTEHHRRLSKRPHWHIDYLRPQLQLMAIWYTYDPQPREHQWAQQLAALRGASYPFPGFGSSDCGCISHLVRFGYRPSFTAFRRRLRLNDPRHWPFYCEVIMASPHPAQ